MNKLGPGRDPAMANGVPIRYFSRFLSSANWPPQLEIQEAVSSQVLEHWVLLAFGREERYHPEDS